MKQEAIEEQRVVSGTSRSDTHLDRSTRYADSRPASPRWLTCYLVAVVLAYLLLGGWYSIAIPPLEAPDENQHLRYLLSLAQTHQLPRIFRDPLGTEAQQPPLYYLLMAGATGWMAGPGTMPELARMLRRNPFSNGDIGAVGHINKNQFLHGRDQEWPYHGLVLQLHVLRLFSLLLGACTVLVTFRAVRALFPDRTGLAIGALSFVALQPQVIFTTSAVSNDPLEMLFASLVLWQLILLIRAGYTWQRSLGLGILVGLATLTKLNGLLLVPVVLVGAGMALWRSHHYHKGPIVPLLAQCLAPLTLPSLLLAGWWIARNYVLYHEWTGLLYYHQLFGYRTPVASLGQAVGELSFVQRSFWAWFGWVNVPVDGWFYLVCAVLGWLAFAGLLCWSWRQLRAQRSPGEQTIQMQALALFAGAVLLYLGSIVRYTQYDEAGRQGRFLFPVLVPLALGLFLGLSQWLPRRWELPFALLCNFLFGLFAIVALLGYLVPAYKPPPVLAADEVSAIPNKLGAIFGGRIALVGYRLSRPTAVAGQPLRLVLYWRALRPIAEDYPAFIHVYDVHGHAVAGSNTYTGSGNYPTSTWQPGATFADSYDLVIAPDAPAPEQVLLEAGLIDPTSGARLPVRDASGESGTAEHLGWMIIYPARPPAAPPIAHPAAFANHINLVGYSARLAPSGVLQVTLTWRATAPVGHDYVVFVHLVDAQRHLLAQQDSVPRQATYPTSQWRAGELVEDTYQLALPPGSLRQNATGQTPLQVEVGLYDYASGQRLALLTPGSADRENAIVLPAQKGPY